MEDKNMKDRKAEAKTWSAADAGTISLGGELTVNRLGFGAHAPYRRGNLGAA
jgi:hypothetical protein